MNMVERAEAGVHAPTSPRRSILPATYSEKAKNTKNLRVSFSPFARMLAVESKEDFSEEERLNSWWQKSDYEDFRKSTSQLVRSMLNENINGWLALKDEALVTKNSQPSRPVQGSPNMFTPKRQLPPKTLAEVQENQHVDQKAKTEQKDLQAHSWWKRFGDVASFHESRRRQALTREAIRIVLEEQSRQRMFSCSDANKIRLLYMESTAWARDWAMALAAAKADEVHSGGGGVLEGKGGSHNNDDDDAISKLYAMKVSLSSTADKPASPVITNRVLDANTSSQIRYRQVVCRRPQQAPQAQSAPVTPVSPVTAATSISSSSGNGDKQEDCIAGLALAKKAAGFGANDSPIGAIPQLLASTGK